MTRQRDTEHVQSATPTPGEQHRQAPEGNEVGEYAQYHGQLAELASLPHDDLRRKELRSELIRNHMPLARHIAQRFRHRGLATEDLQQVALLGLVNAIDRYQPDRGTGFLAYAVPTIMGEIRRHFRDTSWAMHVPRRLQELHLQISKAIDHLSQQSGHAPTPSEIAEHLKLPIADVYHGLQATNAYRTKPLTASSNTDTGEQRSVADTIGEDDENIEHIEHRETLQPLVARLPERERKILILRFYGNMTQTEIARRMGLSQMHISRLLATTLQQLREQMDTE